MTKFTVTTSDPELIEKLQMVLDSNTAIYKVSKVEENKPQQLNEQEHHDYHSLPFQYRSVLHEQLSFKVPTL
jgi:hypothetical protein